MVERGSSRWRWLCLACAIGLGIPTMPVALAQPPVVPEEDPQEAIRKAIEELKNGVAPKPKPVPTDPTTPPADDDELQKQRAIIEKNKQQRAIGMGRGAGLVIINGRIVVNGQQLPNGFPPIAPGDYKLGVRVEKPTPALAEQLGLDAETGLVIIQVIEGSAADKHGLKKNDILLTLNGKPISDLATDFVLQIREMKPGSAVRLSVLRQGKKLELDAFNLPEGRAAAPPMD